MTDTHREITATLDAKYPGLRPCSLCKARAGVSMKFTHGFSHLYLADAELRCTGCGDTLVYCVRHKGTDRACEDLRDRRIYLIEDALTRWNHFIPRPGRRGAALNRFHRNTNFSDIGPQRDRSPAPVTPRSKKR